LTLQVSESGVKDWNGLAILDQLVAFGETPLEAPRRGGDPA
jgi:hypothetical protein